MKAATPTSWSKTCAILCVCLILLVAMYRETAGALVRSWSKDPLGHGYLIFPIVLYLVWIQREKLVLLRPLPNVAGVPVLATLAILWMIGNRTDVRLLEFASFLTMIVAFVWTTCGSRAMRLLLFPLGCLFLALPLGELVVPWLQAFTARWATGMLRLTGVPVFLENHVIAIPGSAWEVQDACSGVNYLMSSLAVGYLYAGRYYRAR